MADGLSPRWSDEFSFVKPVVAALVFLAMAGPLVAVPVTVPTGTELDIRLVEGLSTQGNEEGEYFQAVLGSDLRVDNRKVAPAGSKVRGRVVELKKPRRLIRRGKMTLKLVSIEIGGTEYRLNTSSYWFEAQKDGSVAANTTAGAYSGGLAGAAAGRLVSDDPEDSEDLAVVGAAVGAFFANKKNHVEARAGSPISFYVKEAFGVEVAATDSGEKEPKTPPNGGENAIGNGKDLAEILALLKEIQGEVREIKGQLAEVKKAAGADKVSLADRLVISLFASSTLILNPAQVVEAAGQNRPIFAALLLHGVPLLMAILFFRRFGGDLKAWAYVYLTMTAFVIAMAAYLGGKDGSFFNMDWLATGLSTLLLGIGLTPLGAFVIDRIYKARQSGAKVQDERLPDR